MGPAKIKRWFEKNGVAIKSVETEKLAGSPVVLAYQVFTKNGKKGKLAPDCRSFELENLRREFVKA